jgi:uncharacterized protein YqiB (DUF1249 family)
VSERPAKQLTLRELFTAAERQARDLVSHLDLNFQPKLNSLRKLVRVGKEESTTRVSDVAIRNQAAQVLESERYTAQLYARLEEYAEAIDEQVKGIVEAEEVG